MRWSCDRRLSGLTPLIVPVALIAAGCATTSVGSSIAEFEQGVKLTASTIGIYYAELNAFERELYLEERALDPSLEVLITGEDGTPTPLAGSTFDAQSIKARTDAIATLGLYAQRLGALAEGDAAALVEASSKTLTGQLTQLADRFSALPGDLSAPKYVGPLKSLAGLAGRTLVEHRRDELLRETVDQAAAPVDAIVDLLTADLVEVVRPQRLTGTKQRLAELVADYNARRTTLSASARRTALTEIRKTQERYDLAVLFNPAGLMNDLREAHRAIVADLHRSARERGSITSLESLERFRLRAEEARDEALRLRDLRGGAE
jgi:hypothetical protein